MTVKKDAAAIVAARHERIRLDAMDIGRKAGRAEAQREADQRADMLSQRVNKLSEENRTLRKQVEEAHGHIVHLDHQLLVIRAVVTREWMLPGRAPTHMIGTAETSIDRPSGRALRMVPDTSAGDGVEGRA